jgi:hypothetical protein
MGSKIPLTINDHSESQGTTGTKKRAQIGLLTNPNARQARKVPAEVSGVHHVLREEITASPDAVPAALDRLLAHGIEALIVNGGDGTLGAVIAHLERHRLKTQAPLPKLIPVLGGTNNSVAKDVGAVGRLDAVKKQLAAAPSLSELETIRRATLYVDRGSQRLGCGFVFSTGLIARFADAYYAGSLRGPVQVAKVVIEKLSTALLPTQSNRAFWAFEPNDIVINGQRMPLPNGAALSYCSTIDTQILFFKPFLATASELARTNGFNVLVNALPKTTILRHFFKFVLGKYSGEGHALAVGRTLTLSGTKRIMLDGEMHDIGENEVLTLSPGPVVEFLRLK